MIRVIYTKNRMTLRGHAGYAPRGQDIVCAAVSALVYALVAALEEKGAVREVHMQPGQVSVAGAEGCEAEFRMIHCGLAQLAARYPQYVHLEE